MRKSVIVFLFLSSISFAVSQSSDLWVGAYLRSDGHWPVGHSSPVSPETLKTSEIDWNAINYLIYANVYLNHDSVFNSDRTPISLLLEEYRHPTLGTPHPARMTPDKIREVVDTAHAHGKPVLMSIISGPNDADGFALALVDGSMSNLVDTMIAFMERNKLDGWDIDYEWGVNPSTFSGHWGISEANRTAFQDFIDSLRTRMDRKKLRGAMLTAAIKQYSDGQQEITAFANIQTKLDRIFVMTYDYISGISDCDSTFYNSNLKNDSVVANCNTAPYHSTKTEMINWLASSIDESKLAVGTDWYGQDWRADNMPILPRKSLAGVHLKGGDSSFGGFVRYREVMRDYYPYMSGGGNYTFSANAQCASIGVAYNQKGDGLAHFVPFEDSTSVKKKVLYARDSIHIGGTFAWELAAGYLRTPVPTGDPNDRLLQTVKSNAYTFNQSGSSSVRSGVWSLISVPLNVPNMAKNSVWSNPDATSAYFSENGYTGVNGSTKLVNGKGYWIKHPSGTTSVSYSSAATVNSAWVKVKQGWNTLGTLSAGLPIGKIRSLPDSIVTSKYWEYNPSTNNYVEQDSLIPGKGYWVRVNKDGVLRLDQSLAIASVPTPPNDQPPPTLSDLVPPAPVLSCYNCDYPDPVASRRTDIPEEEEMGEDILILSGDGNLRKGGEVKSVFTGEEYPFLNWTRTTNAVSWTLYRQTCPANNSNCSNAYLAVYAGTDTSWSDPDFPFAGEEGIQSYLRYKVKAKNVFGDTSGFSNTIYTSSGELPLYQGADERDGREEQPEIPAVTALLGNYPNPFNPTTTISYDLAQDLFVTLKVYDILGQEVTTLINEQQSAGHKFVTFDFSKLSSGTYLYRLQAGDVTETKKLQLMK